MSNSNVKVNFGCVNPFHFIMGVLTAIIGYEIHGSLFWAIVDFIFYPIAIVKWLICQELTLSIIKEAFSFFLK